MECEACLHTGGIHELNCWNNDTNTRKWCEAEDAIILNMVQDGSDHKTISGFINRSMLDVIDRFKLLAVKFYDAGQTDLNIISTLTGLSVEQLRDVIGKKPSRHGCEWTNPEEEMMLAMSKSGRSYEQIAKCLSRTPTAINIRLNLVVERLYKTGQTDPGMLSETTGLPLDNIKTVISQLEPNKPMTFEQGETIIQLLTELKQLLVKPVKTS